MTCKICIAKQYGIIIFRAFLSFILALRVDPAFANSTMYSGPLDLMILSGFGAVAVVTVLLLFLKFLAYIFTGHSDRVPVRKIFPWLYGIFWIVIMYSIGTQESTWSWAVEARTVISQLSELKNAAHGYYRDTILEPSAHVAEGNAMECVFPYLKDYPIGFNARYFDSFTVCMNSGDWWAGCDVSRLAEGIRVKVARRAIRLGLVGTVSINNPLVSRLGAKPYKPRDSAVWMHIRTLTGE